MLSDVISDFIFEIVAINITSNSAIIYIITLFVNYMHISTLLSNRAKNKNFNEFIVIGDPFLKISLLTQCMQTHYNPILN
ncbi:hypothetical protein DCR29_05245 [Campylobacter coli]|nr:hypothetical protein [Campylobacter coli]